LLLGIIQYSFHHSDVFNNSLVIVSQNQRVVQLIGSPLKPKYFITGAISIQNYSGDADIFYVVNGPNGSLTIHAVAEHSHSVWTITKLKAEGDDVLEFDLLQPPNREKKRD
jgi:hypothetical protein